MILQRKRFRSRLAFLNTQTDAAVTLQAAWKGARVRRNYKGLTEQRDPPIGTVRRFLHLLDQTDSDFNEELLVGELKESVVRDIKNNQQLETEVNAMDTKIELLIKNRIALQDVVRQSKVLEKQRKKGENIANHDAVAHHTHGLKAMDKASRKRLESYQHLFYLLQTNPKYLASLVFIEKPLDSWSHMKASKFLERIIETTYVELNLSLRYLTPTVLPFLSFSFLSFRVCACACVRACVRACVCACVCVVVVVVNLGVFLCHVEVCRLAFCLATF
jgi:Ras GTPase-activating-like protein IQGAP1